MPEEPFSLRLYRRLLRFYPAGFRETYAGVLERQFRDELADSRGAGLVALWIRLFADLAASVPAQFSRELMQDARHTVRLWRRRPWQTGFALVALAIGIGASTGAFSVVNALLLRSLPFRDADRLATLRLFFPPHDTAQQFHDWRQRSTYLSDAAVVEEFDVNLGGEGEWRRGHTAQTSWNFFGLLGARPAIGRVFAPGEDSPGRNEIAVIGYGLWQELFGGDPRTLGSTIRVDGTALTVVGVAPRGFDFPGKSVLWRPGSFSAGNNGWETIGRLKPGITWGQAGAAFALEADRLWPDRPRPDKLRNPPRLVALRDELAGPSGNGSLIVLGCVALILLIACTNVANLLLARTADRTTELSIRSALGASRARLSQQLFTECMLLSAVAAGAGVLVAYWTTQVAAKVQPAPLSSQGYSLVDTRVLIFAIVLSAFTGVLFGVLPSFAAGHVHLFDARGSGDRRGSRMIREALLAAQVMLTVVLLAGSISIGRAFLDLMGMDRGFDRGGVVTVNVSLRGTTHAIEGRSLVYFQQVLERVRRLPGVRSASATEFLPVYATGFIGGRLQVDGRRMNEATNIVPVMAGYFRTMGGRILAGREFTEADIRENARTIVVSDAFASKFGSPAEMLGRSVVIGNNAARVVVGVVRSMDYMAQGESKEAAARQAFVPSHSPGGFFSTFVVRVDGRAEDRLGMIAAAVRSVDPQVPIFGVKTMEQRMAEALARPAFYRTAVGWFAGFALLLSAIGIYGTVSYAVSRRSREMGVRIALGTTPGRVRLKTLREGFLTIAVGAVPGMVAAALSGRLFGRLVDGAKPASAETYAATALFIAAIAAIGIWAATRPLSRLDIAEILRSD